MNKREFGDHLKLNHAPSRSKDHIEEHKKIIQAKLQNEKDDNIINEKKRRNFKAVVYPDNYTLGSKFKMPIVDQGTLGSCVSNSFASIVQSLIGGELPSRLYLYHNALVASGEDYRQDWGLDVLASVPVFLKYGITNESNWVYNENKFGELPNIKAYQGANLDHNITKTSIPQTDKAIKNALLNDQFITFGMNLYTSFLSNAVAKTGIVPMPVVTKETIEGGHCMHIVGWTKYKDGDYYIVRNSWGTGWGNNGDPINPVSNKGNNGGFCFIPSEYILSDVLVFELVGISISKK